jgi:hypothetical protein
MTNKTDPQRNSRETDMPPDPKADIKNMLDNLEKTLKEIVEAKSKEHIIKLKEEISNIILEAKK